MSLVLVTRPEGQERGLITALHQHGYQTDSLPMLNIVPFNQQDNPEQCETINQCVAQLERYQHIVFVSTNAVHTAFAWINQHWQNLPSSIRWYPIGKATAQALAQYVAQVEQAGVDMDSETLLLNPHLQSIQHDKVLIFRGQGGRNFLHDTLIQRGAEVQFCELYQRRFIRYKNTELAQKIDKKPDFLIVTSTETIQALLEQAIIDKVETKILTLRLVVPGQRVAQYAKQRGFVNIVTSANAGTEALIETLEEHNK